MLLLDSLFDPAYLTEDDDSTGYDSESIQSGETSSSTTLATLLLELGSDPSKNLISILDFGPQFLNCRRLSYGPADEQTALPSHLEALRVPVENHRKLLTLFDLEKHPDNENLTIFTALIAQQERRLQDITRIKGLEEYTHQLFEACPDGIVITDDYGFILTVNRAMTAITRKSKDELNGLRVSQLSNAEGRAHAFKAIRRLRKHSRARFDCRIKVGNNRTIPVSISFRDFNFQGKPLILSTVRDLSDLEDEVTRCTSYEQSLSRSIDNATDGFIRYDQFGRITKTNPYIEKLTGVYSTRLIGRSIDDLLAPSCLRHFRKAIAQVTETGYCSFSCAIYHADGTEIPVHATLMQFELEGENYFRLMLQRLQKTTDQTPTPFSPRVKL